MRPSQWTANNVGVDDSNVLSNCDVLMTVLSSSLCLYNECSHLLREEGQTARPAHAHTQTSLAPLAKHSGLSDVLADRTI